MAESTIKMFACPEAAAVELMKTIAQAEQSTDKLKEALDNPRAYYLKLYGECLSAVRRKF